MKSREILLEILKTGKGLIEVPFRYSRTSIIKPKDIRHGGSCYRSVKYLNNKKLIYLKEVNNVTTIFLTEKGKKRAIKHSLENLEIKKPKKWDKKWRIVVFDIPDKFKVSRNCFKKKLDELGFFMIQKSVYLHPYECFDEIEFIRTLYGIRVFVKYVLAEDIEEVRQIIKKFPNLK